MDNEAVWVLTHEGQQPVFVVVDDAMHDGWNVHKLAKHGFLEPFYNNPSHSYRLLALSE